MRLTELEPRLLLRDAQDPRTYHIVEDLPRADGISFICPHCLAQNDMKRPGVHSVICWFRGKVPDDLLPGPGRWTPAGSGPGDLSLIPGDPPMAHSVLISSCMAHFYITMGEVTPC